MKTAEEWDKELLQRISQGMTDAIDFIRAIQADAQPTAGWMPLSEWLKSTHKYFWVKIDDEHEPEIIWIDDVPNQFFCKGGLFSNLSNLVHRPAIPIFLPPSDGKTVGGAG